MKTAIVTGANQGLGFALVEALIRHLAPGSRVYLTARNKRKGLAALEELKAKGLDVLFHQLDVDDVDSIHTFADYIKEKENGIDIFISNAAARISKDKPQALQARDFIETNNHGTYRVLKSFLPLMNEDSKYLVVASGFGSLRQVDSTLHGYFDYETKTLEAIEEVMDTYVKVMEEGLGGWPGWINIPSKIGQVASMKIANRQVGIFTNKDVYIHAVCPGLMDTQASRPWFDNMDHAQTPYQATEDILWLLEEKNPMFRGQLVQHKNIIEWR